MSSARLLALLAMMSILICVPARSAQFGTQDEAIAMVKRVQEKLKKDGSEATFKAITSKAKIFNDRDLYPFVYDMNGVVLAHGAKADLVGKNLLDFRDQDGKFVIRKMIDVVNGPGSGWVDLRWMNPLTNEVEAKSSYVEKMGQYWVGVGVYTYEQVNANTIGIVSGSPNADDTYLQIAYDMAAVLNGSQIRILPIVGVGGPQNIRDVRFLRGIDIGLTQVNILNSFRRSNETLGKSENKIVYISKLYNEEMHLVVRRNITSLEQLKGQKVNFDQIGSGTNYTVRDIFKRIGLQVEEVSLTQSDALEKVRNGTIAATVLISGKPALSMQKLSAKDGLRFLPIPYSTELASDYLPATISHEDYPDFVPPGQSIDTIAVGAVLISYNWQKDTDRYRRVQKFVEMMFPRINEFAQPPFHVKWRDVNLAVTLPGWDRFKPAQDWLDVQQPRSADQSNTPRPAGLLNPSPKDDRLFQEFLEWKRVRGNPANQVRR